MQLQCFGTLKDNADEDWSFISTSVVAHQRSVVPRHQMTNDENGVNIEISEDHHIRVKTCWKTRETGWVSADLLKEQNTWTLAKCAMQNKLTSHPDFAWTLLHLKNKQVIDNAANVQAM